MLPFIVGITYEILGESGFVPYLPLGELGFLGIAIAASLQMTNSIIKTDERLAVYRQNLEQLVEERTAKLEVAQEQILAETQEKAVMSERTRIARDLHDAVTQTIYSASLIAEVLPGIWERNSGEGQRNLVKLRQLVRGALAEMRALLFELRPDSLEAAALTTLLTHLGDALTGRTRIPVSYQYIEDSTPPTEVKIAFYRVAQEAFNNIVKHSEATQVNVELLVKVDQVTLSITDNGRGFTPIELSEDKMGHQIMSERAQEIHANLELNSHPGKGTLVSISWSDKKDNH